jgi:predicted RNA-binding protein Jag
MKSIMEEASSVAKAIEKGWIQAGKPQEFTIKVFEESTKNFIGITTKPAKIAIFFQEKSAYAQTGHAGQTTGSRTNQPRQRQASPSPYAKNTENSADHKSVTAKKQVVVKPKPQPQQQKIAQPISTTPEQTEKRNRETWTPEMVTATQDWMQGLLNSLDKQHLTFSTEVKNYYLRIDLATPALDNADQEKALFRNCAYLIMQSLRNKFKKSFRGFKIILSSTR